MHRARLLPFLLLFVPIAAFAEPVAAPGDLRLRHDLQLLNDTGLTNIPLTAWPVALGDAHAALDRADPASADAAVLAAFNRVRRYLAWELETGVATPYVSLSGAVEPRRLRGFENTPREEGEVSLGWNWLGERFTLNLEATYAANPFDDDEFRPDGTYLGLALGNWILTAGWQERWWGPSRDGSLILGTNARPMPGIGVQRIASTPFESKWLRWVGPWTLTAFMTEFDDERVVNNARLFGMRGSFRPPRTGLEIGVSRTAQWCGDGRPCELDTFVDLLVGNDNRGVNVDLQNEPGNQLGGIDIRWRLPWGLPVATYMQWIGEDGRGGKGVPGSWLRQVGAEFWGEIGRLSHRTHVEVAETACREGGFGSSDVKPGCAYEHSIYRTGYRYNGRSIGHFADGDSRSYSIGSTLVQSGGQVWNVSIRHMEINRFGSSNARHSLAASRLDITDFQISHERMTRFGVVYTGLGVSRSEDVVAATSSTDTAAFLRWSSR